MNDIKVSIIVAIYKSEQFLKKLLDSILNQTYKNLEIILVDDGSPDNSGKICDDYAKKDSRIKVIHKTNGGACDARNRGILEVTGDYLTIIDGDDWLEPDYIEYMVNIAIKNNVELVMTDNIFTTRDRKQVVNDSISIISGEEAATRIIYPYIPIGPWNKLYKTSLIRNNNINFDVPWSGEGLYFSVTAAQHCKFVGLGHKKIYNYRLNNVDSGLTKYNLTMGTNALYNIKNIKKSSILNSKMFDDACDWHIWKNYNFVLKLIIATNQIEKENRLYKECIKYVKSKSLSVAIRSKLNFKEKIRIVIIGIIPLLYAKYTINKEQKNLRKDLMK